MNKSRTACRIITFVIVLAWSVVTNGQEPPVDRYWGEFEIARVRLKAEPFNGGAGAGLLTNWVPIFAQAVIRVEEAQNFTWEWLGITAPGEMALEGFPNLTFEGFSDDTIEYQELTMDLNPIAPNVWGSAEIFELPYSELTIAGSYKSFSTQTDFEAVYSLNTFFGTVVSRVDFLNFPDDLQATIWANSVGRPPFGKQFAPRNDVVLEPKLRVGGVQIHQFRRATFDDRFDLGSAYANGSSDFNLIHTPTGDANNDGKVGFDDFLILSNGFGAQAAAWEDGDFDFDGVVGFSDFLGLSANFGASSNAAVPEPSSLVLAIIGVGVLILRQSRISPS